MAKREARLRSRHSKIKDMPRVRKPREKLMEKGPEALKDAELLAILLGVGYQGRNVLELARRIISEYSPKRLADLSLEKLRGLKGIGIAKACLIKAAFELSKRAFSMEEDLFPTIRSPKDVAKAASHLRKNKKENFLALYLNARNQIIHQETISIGILNANIVHPREVFQPAVTHSAASIILTHNHPSGDTTPSDNDIQLTRRMMKAGEIMGIEILDHVIIGQKGYLSMKDKGLMGGTS